MSKNSGRHLGTLVPQVLLAAKRGSGDVVRAGGFIQLAVAELAQRLARQLGQG